MTGSPFSPRSSSARGWSRVMNSLACWRSLLPSPPQTGRPRGVSSPIGPQAFRERRTIERTSPRFIELRRTARRQPVGGTVRARLPFMDARSNPGAKSFQNSVLRAEYAKQRAPSKLRQSGAASPDGSFGSVRACCAPDRAAKSLPPSGAAEPKLKGDRGSYRWKPSRGRQAAAEGDERARRTEPL